MTELSTSRLQLVALDLRHLRLLRVGRDMMAESLGLVSAHLEVEPEIEQEYRQAIDLWLLNVASHPEDYAWYTNWEIILKAENRSIGGIGLSGKPDQDGMVMIGYMVDNRYRNQGHATESLKAIIEWAASEPRLQGIMAETPKENVASQKVLQKNQFAQTNTTDQTLVWERVMRVEANGSQFASHEK